MADFEAKTLVELQRMAKDFGIDNYNRYRKRELIYELLKVLATQEGRIFSQGVLEILPEGYGFLRVDNYEPGPNDVYVSNSQIRRFHLRTGDLVAGQVRPPKENERYFSLLKTQAVNHLDPDTYQERDYFEELTPIYPQERLVLETEARDLAMRLVDLIAPVGKGQRGMIVAPPKAGKQPY